MEEMNNNINPNQQPQEEEEKKKKNKFVAWWLGLNKWAKVGICAGGVAAITLAIVLPLTLTNRGETTFTMHEAEGFYESDVISLKKDVEYTFKLNVTSEPPQTFAIQKTSEEGTIQLAKSCRVLKENGEDCKWSLVYDDKYLAPGYQITEGTALAKITVVEDCANVKATFVIGK